LEIQLDPYAWTLRVVGWVQRFLRLNIKLHGDEGLLEAGDIFVFNHFARVETFVPQWLLHRSLGAYCRSVAAAELFRSSKRLGEYLYSVGALPTDLPDLVPYCAAEVMRGRKIIVFPEGGMVKDRKIVDPEGRYAIYSRSARERRKLHTGAARILRDVALIKRAILTACKQGREDILAAWGQELEMPIPDLLRVAERPSLIVPANITFFPLRVGRNVLADLVERFGSRLSHRAIEELLIEGNFLLRHTDMDIRLGTPVRYAGDLGRLARWSNAWIHRGAVPPRVMLDRLTAPGGLQGWVRRMGVCRLRDAYMRRMYREVTVNLSHLAAGLLMRWVEGKQTRIDGRRLRDALYQAVKAAQSLERLNLHRGLEDPRAYAQLPDGEPRSLAQFLDATARLGLVVRSGGDYVLQRTLAAEVDFDAVRVENPVRVYANEIEPLAKLGATLDRLVQRGKPTGLAQLARMRFEDELRRHAWQRKMFTKPEYAAMNALQSDPAAAEPFLLESPGRSCGAGILLVHGFLASPLEVRSLGERLRDQGFVVLGLRLSGHGTSPWELAECGVVDWMADMRRGYAIVSALAERVAVVGFSTGAALALALAAEHPGALGALVCAAAPVNFITPHMSLVPWLNRSSRIAQAFVGEARARFRAHQPDHPEINYQHVPLAAMSEVIALGKRLPELAESVHCPCLFLQASEDPVVHQQSAQILYDAVSSADKSIHMLPTDQHGIVVDDLCGCQEKIVDYLTYKLAKPGAGWTGSFVNPLRNSSE